MRAALPVSIALGLACCAQDPAPGEPATLTVFAPASAADVFREAGRRFEAETDLEVVLSFDASSRLARQITAGAPADVYASANPHWMDVLEAAGLILPETRRDLLANSLVMIAPAGHGFEVGLTRGFDFAARLPEVRRIAVGDPAHVPAGLYARQALETLGWWETLAPRLVPAHDARAALRLVEIGEADAGIVYATDARRSSAVEVVAALPAELHEPIRYPVARCTGSAAGEAFVEFLRTPAMRAVFEDAGFAVLPAPGGSAEEGR